MWTKTALLLLALVALAHADVYMHNPRGSNNRLNESNNNRNNANRLFDSQNNNRGGYNVGDTTSDAGAGDSLGRLEYFKTSVLRLEWTNQHGGRNPNVNTEVIIQYTCSDSELTTVAGDYTMTSIRDGVADTNRITDEGQTNRGRHEPVQYFQDCNDRTRNEGLFLGGENPNAGQGAGASRQNTNGNDYGTECVEERDYYPYWHPSVWKDVAVLTSNTTRCPMYQAESQNVMPKGHCVGNTAENNMADCAANGGTWTEEPAWGLPAPDCRELAFSRDNHLGNSDGGEPLHYNWTIPTTIPNDAECVVRIRYNISTSDYDGWNTYYEEDEDGNEITYISNDPQLNVLKGTGRAAGVQINVDVNQFGRTFQDRSHVFEVKDRPANIPAGATIYNLNVRGRRGNIVETYPSVEYDFMPRHLTIGSEDYVHIAWTGSLSTPAGAGQGAQNTDKSNVVCIANAGSSVPLKFDDPACTLFPTFAMHEEYATVGLGGANIDDLLNDAPATYIGTPFSPAVGTHFFMCTRNNHFSNREHKGSLTKLSTPLPAPM